MATTAAINPLRPYGKHLFWRIICPNLPQAFALRLLLFEFAAFNKRIRASPSAAKHEYAP